jgi:hypothetical protein
MDTIRYRDIFYSGAAEAATNDHQSKFLLGLMACGLAFEWGTGNEALLAYVGSHAYGIVGSNNLLENTFVTGAVTGGTSMLEQSLLGVTMAKCIPKFPKTLNLLQTKFDAQPIEKKSLFRKFTTGFFIGTPAYLTCDNIKEPKTTQQNVKEAIGVAALIGGGVAAVSGTTGFVSDLGTIYGFKDAAETFINILEKPYTYVGLFGLIKGPGFINKRLNRKKSEKEGE